MDSIVTALHHPAPRPLARFPPELAGLLAPPCDVRCAAELRQHLPHVIVSGAFVPAPPVRLLDPRLWPRDHAALAGGTHQLHGMPISAVDAQA